MPEFFNGDKRDVDIFWEDGQFLIAKSLTGVEQPQTYDQAPLNSLMTLVGVGIVEGDYAFGFVVIAQISKGFFQLLVMALDPFFESGIGQGEQEWPLSQVFHERGKGGGI